MGKKKASCEEAARRAWRLLRITLLWARKGSSLKCRLMAELRHFKHLKGYKKSKDMIRFGERELSFDETPVLHLRMSRPASLRFMIPCITPEVTDFDYDFGNDGHEYDDVKYAVYGARRSFLKNNAEDNQDDDDDDTEVCEEEEMVSGDAGIDNKADEFIAKFYQQMKLQREISFQQRHNAIKAV